MIENFHMSVWKTIQDMNYVHATTWTENLLDLLFYCEFISNPAGLGQVF